MLSDEKNKKYIWYPDEEICTRRKSIPIWVKQQRKIAIKSSFENTRYYFTIEMLKIRFRVFNSVKGLDPNKKESPQLKRWFKRNKGTKKRKMTEEQRKQKREQLAKAREIKKQKHMELSDKAELAA
jgi:hypothetical protein